MKRIFCLFALMLCAGISLFAQKKNGKSQVELKSGYKIEAYVDILPDGDYKLTTEDGEEFYFSAKDIKKITGEKENKKEERVQDNHANLKYWEYKRLYSARDYKYETGDKYNVGGITAASVLFPGLGQYITGCQAGWGVLQTLMFASGVGAVTHGLVSLGDANGYAQSDLLGRSPDSQGYAYHYRIYQDWLETAYLHIGIGGVLWLSSAIWSACSANKAAKIKNMYLRDVRNGKTVAFTVDPYVDFCNGTFAMSGLQPVTGLSLKMSF